MGHAQETVEEFFERVVDGWKTNSGATVAGCFAEDGSLINPFGQRADGRAAIADMYSEYFGGMLSGTSTTFDHVSVRPIDASHAFVDAEQTIVSASGDLVLVAHMAALLGLQVDGWRFIDTRPYTFAATSPSPPGTVGQTGLPDQMEMEQASELCDVMLGFYQALASGDVSYLDRHISTSIEVRGIGTDPEEWWAGSRLLEVWKEQIEAMGGSMPLTAGDPEAYREGAVGWVADRPTLKMPDGEVPLRFTAVFHREHGDWKMIQAHGSLGVTNEESFGQELPA